MSSPTPQEVSALLGSAAPGATVYLIGAAGCGMSALGHLLIDAGFVVHGSDLVTNLETEQLQARGAVIYQGHRAAQVERANPVLVAFSPAVHDDNPELIAARAIAPTVRRAILLAAFATRRKTVCVSGMHGKTTTSSLLAFALDRLGAEPSYAVGATVPQLTAHARFVSSDDAGLFVIEADESDGTLSAFQPAHTIVLNIDDEHLEHFGSVENVGIEFSRLAERTSGAMIYCADDPNVARLFAGNTAARSFGFSPGADYRVELARGASRPNSFTIALKGQSLGEFSTALIGEKNVSNASAAVALLHLLGYEPDRIAQAIAPFKGASRRQQELFSNDTIRVFDDYGHHPTEIRATLRAFKQGITGRLVVVFQPHRFTRTARLMNDFAGSFGDVDRLFLTEVYAASEPPIAGATSAALAERLRSQRGVDYVPRLGDVSDAVLRSVRPGDTVVFLGAGDITRAAHAMAAALKQQTSFPNMSHSAGAFQTKLQSVLSPEAGLSIDEPLARRTTLRVGGKADFYVEPASEQDLAAVLRLCKENSVPFTIIGRGSNLLIRDGGIRGVVLSLGHPSFSEVRITGENLHCGAGAKLKSVSVEARRAGLAGLEFLEGIPGSVGGALRMNAGAMGSWMFEVVDRIRFMDFAGNVFERMASEVNVEYRGCPLFKTHISLAAVLRGTPASKETIQSRANTYNAKRWETQPAQPSAGCIFKNPTTVPAGKLIDELGLKGTRRGGAMVSTVHGNFIVNEGDATAKDVLELIDFIKQTAKAKRGIELETEVEILGD